MSAGARTAILGTMRLIALEHELDGGSADAYRKLAASEASRLWELVQAGIVRESYFRSGCREAVLILECADLDEARAHLATLPLVAEGRIDFELIGLRPYAGFARLFAEQPPGRQRNGL